MALKQQLEQKQRQKLSHLQMQVIKLTELNCLELEEKIKQEIEDNPALEEGTESPESDLPESDPVADDAAELSQDDLALGDYLNEEEIPDYHLQNRQSDSDRSEIPFADSGSLYQSLLEQLALCQLSGDDLKIAQYIIWSIDEAGYLARDIQAISDDLLFQINVDAPPVKIEAILRIIQQFDPPGIAARNPRECLVLQLERMQTSSLQKLALDIVTKHFDKLTKRRFDKLAAACSISQETLKQALDVIYSLNPKPGNSWDSTEQLFKQTVIPDFIVETNHGEVSFWLNNQNIPPLKISRHYTEMLKGYAGNSNSVSGDTRQAVAFIKQKLDAARWFIDAVKQRHDTMQRTMEAIIKIQYDFFLSGDESRLKPMVLREIAAQTGFDISTISRITQNKYFQAFFGIYPLKFLFSEKMKTNEGEDVSSRRIKALLKNIIDGEDKNRPLTDEQLTDMLKANGLNVARRTVAKYREQMDIAVARLRKEI